MGLGIAQKIIKAHLLEGKMEKGETIGIRIDQTLTQDATGTMVYLEFMALGAKRVKTQLSVSYVDHNTLQTTFRNADDHLFLQTAASKFGVYFSRPGNGICHQVHLERFGAPGKTLLGSDSHTPTQGGLGMLAIGAGGLDVALAMAGEPFYLKMPEIIKVELKGRLKPFVAAKDVILELLRRLSVKGGVGKIFEYTGEGVKSLSVPERATITNMGAELGATTSIFPSDENTYRFLKAQKRERDFSPLQPDPDAAYDDVIEINLSELVPLIAKPHMPDNVVPVSELEGTKVHQVAIGSCTNSSLKDIMTVAHMLKNQRVHPSVSAALVPGSRQILKEISKNGALEILVSAGVRILESACGPCIGMGFAPPSKGISLRTFNRNFLGRSGTKDAGIYLASPETAAAAIITGEITDPGKLGIEPYIFELPEEFAIDDQMILPPSPLPETVEIRMGPNIKPFPENEPLGEKIKGEVLIKVKDDITTDHILRGGAEVLPLRSNIPEISKYTFSVIDPDFYKRAKEKGGGFIVGGENYGQGSSREHAAIAPMYLGIKAVLAKSFSRIHLANLVNFGILPLVFENKEDYDRIEQQDVLEIDTSGIDRLDIKVKNLTKNFEIKVKPLLDKRGIEIMKKGGVLPYVREKQREEKHG